MKLGIGAWFLVLATPVLASCDPDTAVFVEATIASVNLSVTQSSLVTAVSGGFVLRLHLGPRASDSSEVDLGAFSVTNSDQNITIHEPLGVQNDPPFPVIVDIDSDVFVTVSILEQDNQMAVDALDSLCAADGVRIVGALDDALRGGTITVASPTVHPSGCP